MYQINSTHYGYRITLSGFIQPPEMQNWVNESEELLKKSPENFHVFVDMRSLKTLPKESQLLMEEGQKMYKTSGMVRSVVIVDNAITQMQFRRIAAKSGIDRWERYIDSSSVTNWEEAATGWLLSAVNPDVLSQRS